MNKPTTLLVLGLTLAACHNLYAPTSNTSTAQMFEEACARCHKPIESSATYFQLTQEKNNTAYIADKIRNGGIIMPKFSKLSEAQISALSQYSLEHSQLKK